MSPAEWLALGSAVALAGCSGKEIPAPVQTRLDAGAPGAGGEFTCGDYVCSTATEFCFGTGMPDSLSYACQEYDSGDWVRNDAACGALPTCACSSWSRTSTCSCTDDDAGAVTVVACHSCYGSPPARLERIARA